jgi:hypothetical protein
MSVYRNPVTDRSYMHREDSRIIGSDFVIVSMRPPDPFFTKVDALLKTARDTDPKYW